MIEQYSPEEQAMLLEIARAAVQAAAAGREPAPLDLDRLPPALTRPRACFVTLYTADGDLRGCTGTLTAHRPLAVEVSAMAVQTALYDPRFMPVQSDEVPDLQIEISILTPARPLAFDRPEDIPRLLRPGVDGVVLMVGGRRATFLPQVWEKVADPYHFLDMLCQKMGLPAGAWRRPDVEVYLYETVVVKEDAARV